MVSAVRNDVYITYLYFQIGSDILFTFSSAMHFLEYNYISVESKQTRLHMAKDMLLYSTCPTLT